MNSSPEDQKVDEVYHQVEQEILEKRKKEKSWINKISPTARIAIVAGVVIGIWYLTHYDVPFQHAMLWVAGGAIAIYMLIAGEPDMTKLTEAECAYSLHRHLREMQKHPLGGYRRIPNGKIRIDFVGKERWLNGKPWKREIGFHIINEDGVKKTYSAEINVWDGDIIAAKKRFEGFTGHESRDTEIIMSRDLRFEKAKSEYMNTKGGK